MWNTELMLLLLIAFGLSPCDLLAQRAVDRIVISGEPSGDSCRIEIQHVARLGEGPDGLIIGWPVRVVKDSRDRWFLFEPGSPSAAKVYRYDGGFLRSLGRDGQGPGEFRQVAFVQEHPEGTLNFFDWGNGRISRFTIDFDYLDQLRLEVQPIYLLITSEGRVVVSAIRLDSGGRALPLHLINSNGRVSTSFGTIIPPYPSSPGNHQIRAMTSSREGGIWEGTLANYELRHWDRDGELTLVVERDVPWFRPHRDPATRTDRRSPSPKPKLQGIRQDGEGRLWTAVYLPQDDWRAGFFPDTLPSGLVIESPLEEGHYDTRIEVLDPKTGTALASVTLPEAVGGFVGAGVGDVYVYAQHMSAIGEPFVDIWLLKLVREPSEQGVR